MSKKERKSNLEIKTNQRKLEKQLGIRFHTDESKPGETFTQFKNRMKSEKQSLF